ncbi:nucleoside deaminase [Lentibacillus cibarius]|uniref:Nucleoside deaminase n=1 Tax=Lentibacillus cibarius TaxID=2583219 RepID=A0A549YF92_9BACI|nr:nucleoside deaminase [Lentibacillus cibarius]TRM10559.1 nucleoside deaminase [Lentibacillus cibarius]
MNQFMDRAVELAEENVLEGRIPFGAVLVKDGKAVSEAAAGEQKTYDVTGHAEILAIRKAQDQLQTNDLSGYIMYTSGEPCSMCLTAIYAAGIDNVYYYNSIEEMTSVGMDEWEKIYKEMAKSDADRSILMEQVSLQTDRKNPMQLWYERQ